MLFAQTSQLDRKHPDVKACAAKTLPVLHKHLQRAEEIEQSMKARKS